MTNGIAAMHALTDRPRELVIRTGQEELNRVFLAVADCGAGISAENMDVIFNPFFTTKSQRHGYGAFDLSLDREAHEGRLSASRNDGPGATFQFVIPSYQENSGDRCTRPRMRSDIKLGRGLGTEPLAHGITHRS